MAKANLARRIMMNGKRVFDGKYVAAEDLKGDTTVKIMSITQTQVQGENGKENKLVFRFERATKPFLCNSTNAGTIAGLYSRGQDKINPLDWIGKWVTMYPTTCRSYGDPNCPCIRIREKIPSPPTSRQPTDPKRDDRDTQPSADEHTTVESDMEAYERAQREAAEADNSQA